ncbi:hypothetical protein [Sphingomonas sp. Leaf38]|uniref:hypothetical protein n=1 Tax=Sphingomonas sp. Leaf38 TaxID=1736217 RepID=UPI0006FBF0C8|nr:hypothetical protein [Sphingomonas sp. Leaf38]KQN29381.1 hypothetical protein ASE88_10610 [Sphingomonas sp. Leaf38]
MDPTSFPLSLLLMEQEALARRVTALETHSLAAQLGQAIAQLAGMRLSVDQIAAATARYAGFAFAEAFTPCGGFGAPPMVAGALAVHIVNIRDLVASGGIGGFIEGLLGGIGRLFGGLVGGIVGGTIAGVALPVMLGMMQSIVTTIEAIIRRLGIGPQPATATTTDSPSAATTPTGALGQSATDQLAELRSILDLATGLVQAAGSGAPPPAERLQASLTPAGERWLTMLHAVEAAVASVSRLVEGLTALVPILVGSLALFVDKLDAIKLAIIEMLQFLVRNVLLLRGVVLVTVFDLVASAARLAAGLAAILAETIRGALTGIFTLVGTVLTGALSVFQFLAGALQRTVNVMLRWLVDTLFVVLARFGDLRIFRLITHLVRILPAVLPPLLALIRPSAPALDPAQATALAAAAAIGIPGPQTAGALPSSLLPPMPNVADAIAPPAAVAALQGALDSTRQGLLQGMDDTIGALRAGLGAVATRMETLVADELQRNSDRFATQLALVHQRSTEVAGSFEQARILAEAETAARRQPATGLEAIARAYEAWLTGTGFTTMLDRLTDSFRRTPATDTQSIPGAVVADTVDRVRATIEIADVVIDLTPAAAPARRAEPHARFDIDRLTGDVLAHLDELRRRGLDFAPGAPLAAAV